MKAYLTRRNNDCGNFYEDALSSFFRPFYVEEKAAFMKTDIKDKEKEYLMEIEMAGFDKKDIGLKFENGYLTVSAKKEENEENGDVNGSFLRRERSSSVSRSYYFGDVNEKEIKAKYENGILSVSVPKELPESSTHSIAVE